MILGLNFEASSVYLSEFFSTFKLFYIKIIIIFMNLLKNLSEFSAINYKYS